MPTVELRKHMKVESIVDVLRRRRLKWYGHLLQKGDENKIKKTIK